MAAGHALKYVFVGKYVPAGRWLLSVRRWFHEFSRVERPTDAVVANDMRMPGT